MNLTQNHPHSTPPRKTPQVLLKEKVVYRSWISLHRNFPRIERLGIGQKIETSFLDILEYTFVAMYLASDQKVLMLSKTIAKLDKLKFFMQIAWENKLIPEEKYAQISLDLEEIGRQLGGWRKGLQTNTTIQTKTPQP